MLSTDRTCRRVFVFPGSTSIAHEVVRSLQSLPNYQLFGGGYVEDFPWRHEYDDYYSLPGLGNPRFFKLLRLALRNSKATHLYPANDVSILALAQNFTDNLVTLVTHPKKTVGVATSKKLTAVRFGHLSILPRIYNASDFPSTFPVFAKPDYGHSSLGVRKYDNPQDLIEAGREPGFWEEHLVSDFLPGGEVTVDCFSNISEGLLFQKARSRDTVRDGMSIATSDLDDPQLEKMARVIGSELKFSGSWFFQAKKSLTGKFKLMEIGARLAGFSSLRRAQGVNFAHLSLLEADAVALNVPEPRLSLSAALKSQTPIFFTQDKFHRFWVDLDDTLLHRGAVNHRVLELIRHVKASGAETALITRAAYDPKRKLESLGIRDLFSDVTHITDGSPKEAHLPRGTLCLFMDDSYAERASFVKRSDVHCVDPSVAESVRNFF